MRVTYSNLSPYKDTPQTSWYLDVYQDVGFIADQSDESFIITASYKNRPDKLAYDLYGTVELWWIFYVVNNQINDPIYDMIPGNTIMIPLPSRVSDFFGG